MRNYEHYDIEDFARDDYFITWCLQVDESNEYFWNNWMREHPAQQKKLLDARQLVVDLQIIETEEKESDFEQEIWEGIARTISTEPQKKSMRSLLWKLSSAAAILLLIGAFLIQKNRIKPTTKYTKLEWINFENDSGSAKRITLADRSIVLLEPFSSLKYPTQFLGEQRAVFLKGEAFFDIERDTLKPFLVYANETITKVLGTSFTIHAFEGKSTVEVEVKTGKVAVYAQVAAKQKATAPKEVFVHTDERISIPRPNKKLEVTPNQKVVFNREEEAMKKMIADETKVITQVEKLPQFQFKDESIIKVFQALELAYGIELEFDEQQLKACTITTKLKDEPLFQKLEMLCKALALTFSEKDAIIFIEGAGC